ncbi:hypothetical protein GGH95_005061 [Coemansia sp. RSA 1836]|nr:hypothetical protein GGF38_000960 [Coemansia sp. RSA 25]KAJ2558119.1 hypothetical protein GGH95_005061 [Coemansia sp. RSA 1836]
MQTRSACVQLALAGVLQTAFGQLATIFNDIQSNINNALAPAKNAADSVFDNAGNNIVSFFDQAGNNAANIASNVVHIVTSNQENLVEAQLSSYHSHAAALVDYWSVLVAGTTAGIIGAYM